MSGPFREVPDFIDTSAGRFNTKDVLRIKLGEEEGDLVEMADGQVHICRILDRSHFLPDPDPAAARAGDAILRRLMKRR